MNHSSDYEAGLQMMRTLWGPTPLTSPPSEEFNDRFIIEHLYGRIWTRPQLSTQLRSLITIAALAASSKEEEMRLHLIAARRLGFEREQLQEVMTHLAHYCGWPLAVRGLRLVEATFADSPAGTAGDQRTAE